LIATRDGLFIEGADSPYVNVVAVKAGTRTTRVVALCQGAEEPESG
jgi:ABC-type metal ion transport system substrate-binding protein